MPLVNNSLQLLCTVIGLSPSPIPSPLPSFSPTPIPSVSPTPAPSPKFSQITFAPQGASKPTPNFVPPFSSSLILKGSRGETLGTYLKITPPQGGCLPLSFKSDSAVGAFFELLPYVTTQGSYDGAPLGTWYDPLIPVTQACHATYYWLDVALPKIAEPGLRVAFINEEPISLKIWNFTMQDAPSLPLYVGFRTFTALLGHFGKYDSSEGVLGKKYISMLNAHRLTPYQSFLVDPPLKDGFLDIDYLGDFSFRNMILNFIQPGYFFGLYGDSWTQARLQAAEKTIQKEGLNSKAFTYVMDEPSPLQIQEALRRAKLIKDFAPSLQTIITTEPKPELDPYIDRYVPVMDYFGLVGHIPAANYPHPFWLYVSCMSHGCGSSRSGQTPDLVIDRPSVYARSFFWTGFQANTSALLYYNTVEGYPGFTNAKNLWADLYLFSGHGDGTLLYPGRPGEHGFTSHEPAASLRLKLLRSASFDAEYLKLMRDKGMTDLNAKFQALIQSPRDWSKNESAYTSLREEIGERL